MENLQELTFRNASILSSFSPATLSIDGTVIKKKAAIA